METLVALRSPMVTAHHQAMAEKTYTARSIRRTMRIVRLYQRLWSTYSPHGRRARISLPRLELTLVAVRLVARAAFVALLLAALMQHVLPSASA